MRIVVKENFGRNLCHMLLEDINLAVAWLDDNPTTLATMKVSTKVVYIYIYIYISQVDSSAFSIL